MSHPKTVKGFVAWLVGIAILILSFQFDFFFDGIGFLAGIIGMIIVYVVWPKPAPPKPRGYSEVSTFQGNSPVRSASNPKKYSQRRYSD